jgi:hypothetical protein
MRAYSLIVFSKDLKKKKNLAVKCKPAHSSIPSLTIKQCIENKTSLCFQLYPVEWKRREKKKETQKTKSKSN